MKDNSRIIKTVVSLFISIVFLSLFLIFAFIDEGDRVIYLAGTFDSQSEKNTDTEETATEITIEDGTLAFTAENYEIEIHKDVDMSQYLQCEGLSLEDVKWSSDSGEIYVGSDGHVSINDNGVTCNLIAVSKTNEDIKAQCTVKTRSEAEELVYQVETLNNAHTEDETLDNGVVRLAYDTEESRTIDVDAENVEAGSRSNDYVWDSTLFYALEDVSADSDADGQINSYFVEKKKFLNKDTNNEMEYEIYHNPDTNIINKIVSIEYMDKKLEIIEYYYTDEGKVNFVYVYEDVNYAPSYATPNRSGERFLIHNDSVVTWRVVADGKETNYCSSTAEKERLESGYRTNVKLYEDCDEDIQNTFDEKEKMILDYAYNTFNKMTTDEGVSSISGYVYDSGESGMDNTQVHLMSLDYNCELFTATTDEYGFYEIMIPTRDMNYSLSFAKDNYLEEKVCEIQANVDEIDLVQEIVYLSEEDDNSYKCELVFYDALNKSEDGYGMAALEDVDVTIRRGVNNRNGDVVYENHVSGSYEQVSLTPGMYTIHISKSDYLDSYSSLFVSGNTSNYVEIYATPQLNADEFRIVLTWDGEPRDLDSHLFTPTSDSSSEDYHICFYNMSDSSGNASLDVDDVDGYGPETITINHVQRGLYKFYVCDFTNCSAGDEESDKMSKSSATVRVYGKDGLIQTFNVPVNRNGVIWEVFEIRDGKVIPNQRYYDSIGNRTWWQVDK